MAGDRPRQPAYEIFSIECGFQQSMFRRSAHAGVKEGYPFKNGYLFAVGLSSMKMIADKHRHAAYHNKRW